MLIHGLVILLNGIPLVHNNDYSLAPLMSDTGNLRILLCDALCRIDDNKHHICTLNSAYCTDNAVALKILLNLALSSKTCSVDKHIFPALILNLCINGISCGAPNIRYNDTISTCELIDY